MYVFRSFANAQDDKRGIIVKFYTPMHEVTPKVVAIAVSTVITMLSILLQSCLFAFSIFKLRIEN